jgi:signal transduction histidine kinase
VRAHRRETEISDRGNILIFDKGVGLNLRNKSQRRVQNELIDADSMSVIGRMACSISHDMRHSLSAIYANAEFLERHDLCASERVGQFSHVALYDHGKSQVFGMSDGVRRGRFARSIMIAQVMSGRADGESVFGMVEDDEGY